MEWETIWGSGEHLSPLQMGMRAFVMFLSALLMIRAGGIRMFGKKSVLDHIIVIMLGAVMARGVVGASPFSSTIVAGAILILTNCLLAYGSRKSRQLAMIIKGRPFVLYEDGQFVERHMRKSNLCREDIYESLRLETKQETLDKIARVYIENNGRISFIMKQQPGS